MEFVYRCYMELSSRRTQGFSSPNPIAYSEIESYMRTMQIDLRPREVQAIIFFDNAWRSAVKEFQDRMKEK